MKFILPVNKMKLLFKKIRPINYKDSVILYPQKSVLFSYYKNENILRLVQFNKSYFSYYDDQSTQPFEFDANTMSKIIQKSRKNHKLFICTAKESFIEINSNRNSIIFKTNEPEKFTIPFTIQNHIPIINNKKLDTCFTIKTSELKQIFSKNARYRWYCQITIKDGQLSFCFFDNKGTYAHIHLINY